jgi:hypothetical protein
MKYKLGKPVKLQIVSDRINDGVSVDIQNSLRGSLWHRLRDTILNSLRGSLWHRLRDTILNSLWGSLVDKLLRDQGK